MFQDTVMVARDSGIEAIEVFEHEVVVARLRLIKVPKVTVRKPRLVRIIFFYNL
jgi:hypothetical protein